MSNDDAQMYAVYSEDDAKKAVTKLMGKIAHIGALGMSGQITWSQALSELEFICGMHTEEEDD